MGWRDQSKPVDQPTTPPAPSAPIAAPDAPAAAPSEPAAAPQSGWRTQSKPVDAQPNTPNAPAAPTSTGSGPKPGEPGNQTLPWFSATGDDKIGAWVNTAIDSGTGGLADTAQGYLNKYVLGGPDAEALRKRTEELRGDIGPLGSLSADIVGYGVGPGKIGAGARIAKLIAPRAAAFIGERAAPIVARVLGSGLESSGASVAGTIGHGDLDPSDIAHAGKVGFGVGALTGAIPGGRGADAPTDARAGILGIGAKAGNSPTAALETGEKAAFAPLSTVHYDPGDVAIKFDPVRQNMASSDRVAMRGDLRATVDDISQELRNKYNSNQPVTASDIAGFKRELMDNAQGDVQMRIAGDHGRALDDVLANNKPTNWGTVPQGSNMKDVVDQANRASSKAKSSADIDAWISSAQSGESGVPGDIKKSLGKTNFFNAEPETRPLLQQAGAYKPSVWGQAGRMAGERILGAAAGEGVNYMTGGTLPWWAAAGLGTGASHGVVGVLPKGAPNGLIARLAQARAANAGIKGGFRPDYSPGVKGFGPMITYAPKVPAALGASGAYVSPDQR